MQRGVAAWISPIEKRIRTVVPLLGMARKKNVGQTVQIEIGYQHAGPRLGRQKSHMRRVKTVAAVPVDIGRVAAGIAAMITG